MEQYIPKSALVAEIWKRRNKHFDFGGSPSSEYCHEDDEILGIINTLEVKEVEECEQPEYSCLETIYQCGKKPHWNIGDTLAYYEFCTDREGVCILGKITKVDFDEETCDWIYTFEKGSVCDEQTLLEEQAYKKN